MAPYPLPSLQDVIRAHRLISHRISCTPIKTSHRLSAIATSNLKHSLDALYNDTSLELFFKCENLQHTGSFKFRGATHFLAKRTDGEIVRGVVAYSTGNHALATSHAAHLASQLRKIRIPTSVVLPANCSSLKIEAAKRYGAKVYLADPEPEARTILADEIVRRTGALLVPPADHGDIVMGQAGAVWEFVGQVERVGGTETGTGSGFGNGTEIGTGNEMMAELSQGLDVVVVPSGGGGLLVGAVAVCKGLQVKGEKGPVVFGAEPLVGGPGLGGRLRDYRGMEAARIEKGDVGGEESDGLFEREAGSGRQTAFEHDRHAARMENGSPEAQKRERDVAQSQTIAEGLRSVTGKNNWEHIKKDGNVRDVFAVSEEHIKAALRLCIEELGVVVEPSAAVAFAAALFDADFHKQVSALGMGKRVKVGIVLTGGNVSREDLCRLLPGLKREVMEKWGVE